MGIVLLALFQSEPARLSETCRRIEEHRRKREVEALVALLGDSHPRIRLRAERALRRLTGKTARLIECFSKQANPSVRAAIARALGAHAGAEPILRKALDDPAPAVQAAAIQALHELGARIPEAARRFEDADSVRVRVALLDALGDGPLARRALSDEAPEVRLAALEHLKKAPLLDLLEDPDWRVRSVAIDRIRALPPNGAVPALIRRLGRERGRLAGEIREALSAITGADPGPEPEAWRRWWRRNRKGFRPRIDQGRGGTRIEEGFFGLPVHSLRIAFVIDLSGSMRGKRGDGRSKFQVVRESLCRTLRRLPAEARFNIILLGCDRDGGYDRDERVWADRLQAAGEAEKARAMEFLRARQARGWTNLYDALAIAFEDPEVDTIYLYSDGGASRGTFVSHREIRERIAALNRFRRIRIHSIQPVTEKTRGWQIELMKGLASDSGGRYVRK